MRKNRSTMYSYILAISILAYWIVKRVVASTEERIVARKNACQPCARLPQRERVIGFSLFKQDAAAAREGKSLQTAQDRFRSLGDTFSGVILGQFFISTIDPENAKALLSSQFGHFDSGKKALFGPFLGHSMLTTDGAPWKHSRVHSYTPSPDAQQALQLTSSFTVTSPPAPRQKPSRGPQQAGRLRAKLLRMPSQKRLYRGSPTPVLPAHIRQRDPAPSGRNRIHAGLPARLRTAHGH